MIVIIIFWIAVLALVHTYLIYPALLGILASNKIPNKFIYLPSEDLPGVSVLMAVHNEQDVLQEKIESIISNFHTGVKIEILIGSDASNDNTDRILENMASSNECLRYFLFETRRGKSAIINELVRLSCNSILIITDANVKLEKDTIYQMLKHFKNGNIGLVDSHMSHKGLKNSGISVQENSYIAREVEIKYRESIIWGTMMGPFGGCYAMRKELYRDVPSSFLVDDFYINMNVMASGHKTIIETDALVYEVQKIKPTPPPAYPVLLFLL